MPDGLMLQAAPGVQCPPDPARWPDSSCPTSDLSHQPAAGCGKHESQSPHPVAGTVGLVHRNRLPGRRYMSTGCPEPVSSKWSTPRPIVWTRGCCDTGAPIWFLPPDGGVAPSTADSATQPPPFRAAVPDPTP